MYVFVQSVVSYDVQPVVSYAFCKLQISWSQKSNICQIYTDLFSPLVKYLSKFSAVFTGYFLRPFEFTKNN